MTQMLLVDLENDQAPAVHSWSSATLVGACIAATKNIGYIYNDRENVL
jgi:hypothetical protein